MNLADGRAKRRWGGAGLAVALAVSAASAAVANASPATSRPPGTDTRLAKSVTAAAHRFGLSPALLLAVMRVESAGDPRAVSRAGAMGLMQIMPDTWAELRHRYGLGADPFDVRDNVMAGAASLRELYDRFGAPGFLIAYNAGPRRYAERLVLGRPLPKETRAYLAALAPFVGEDAAVSARVDPKSWTQAPLFPGASPRPSSANSTSIGGPIDPLFISLSNPGPRP